MFSIHDTTMTAKHTTESRVFLPLEAGIAPFPLKRKTPIAASRFDKPWYGLDDEQELADPLFGKSVARLSGSVLDGERELAALLVAKLATATTRCKNAFRRQRLASRTGAKGVVETIWFTSPDNWRPGLVSLNEAASREDIIRRLEAFERV